MRSVNMSATTLKITLKSTATLESKIIPDQRHRCGVSCQEFFHVNGAVGLICKENRFPSALYFLTY
jgi:hypothetical protein